MPKKMKKNKPAAPSQKKPAPAKAGAMGAALKKAAKSVVKKVASSLPKKVAEKPKKAVASSASAKVKSKGKVEAAKPAKKDISVSKVSSLIAAKTNKKGEKKVSVTEVVTATVTEKGKLKALKKEVLLEVEVLAKSVANLKSGKKPKKNAGESVSNKKRCREPACDNDFSIAGYCRMHYIKNWRKIKRKEAILASGQLNNYVEELVSKYPDKYLDVIRQDLASEKDWSKVVVDLELESADEDSAAEDDVDVAAEGVSRARTEFDDDSDAF